MRLRTASSGSSLVLHAAILLVLAAGSYWRVGPLAEPTIQVPFVVVLPPPPAGPPLPAPGATGPARDRAADSRKPLPVELPEIAQPRDEELRPDSSPAGAGQPHGTAGGDEAGIPGGVPDGIPGGTPGGALGGIIGGLHGSPGGGALDGLPGGDRPIHITGGVRPPARILFVKPEYPETARKARVEGKVILEIVVDRKGDVADVRLLRTDPLFDQAAIDAVRRWRYQPALQDGRAVRVYLTVIVEFNLR